MAKATSPASSGPAGSHFEAQVGAHYLLSLLVRTEARGLPSANIDRVEFQRAAEDRPLDDVIIVGRAADGKQATLEIQVKRRVFFTPSDDVFRSVVGQMVAATKVPEFWTSRHELAVATAKSSAKIDGAYQEVLNQAKQIGDAVTFMARIDRAGSVNDDMRTFVDTFRSHLRYFDSPDDDETVWKLLRRFQILLFDFAATGSQSEELAKERSVRALHRDHAERASSLWSVLIELTLDIAADGGDRDWETLCEDIKHKGYRLATTRQTSNVRTVLAEASNYALADINDRIANVSLSRLAHREAVAAALEDHTYIEIRGDSGVGKSGILKHLARQVSTESPILVLSPNRTTAKGWTAFRSVLGFDGEARDLLADLASDGGAYLFVDNLDFFEAGEQKTVSDLVRAAADVPGFSVIVTARRSFEAEGPNWLSVEGLDRAEAVEVGELADVEIEELRHIAPSLNALLAKSSPARDVARNLFRLGRLIKQRDTGESVIRTEAQMADTWWQTSDGVPSAYKRESARILRALGSAALAGEGTIDASPFRGEAIDALVVSGTLKDLGLDRVAFQHDVFREWAIACLLATDSSLIDDLPLDHPAAAAMTRGTELAARLALERDTKGDSWHALLQRLSEDRAHGSWRRSVLVAPARAENAPDLFPRISARLIENRALLLSELIRVLLAVDSASARQVFVNLGMDPEYIPTGLRAPKGSSWLRTIVWIIDLGTNLPRAALPAVVDLFSAWSMGNLGLDPITPTINQWLFHWLSEIEKRRNFETYAEFRAQENDVELTSDQMRSLESSLRSGILLFCHRTPKLAIKYLQSLEGRRHDDDAIRATLKFGGNLAQAAPKELAQLTARVLTESTRDDDDHERRREPFEMVDYEFHPASPTKGPFLALLTHAPEQGLSLIQKLVDHAIEYYSRGKDCGENKIIVPLSSGDRAFPWQESYAWSRQSASHNCLSSALMAMELWGHRRIESGEDVDVVVADVIDATNTSAAGLQVVVDLLLSHWPLSRVASLPYLACPELLCIDRERLALESMNAADFFGAMGEPEVSSATGDSSSLQERPSRRHSIDELLCNIGVAEEDALQSKLRNMLETACARLGEPSKQATLGDPAFMAVHALNLINPDNWRDVDVSEAGMAPKVGKEYVQPESEARHMAPLQEQHQAKVADDHIQFSLSSLLDDASRSSPEFVAAAIKWAKGAEKRVPPEDSDSEWMREQAIYAAAMVAMRDGSKEVRGENLEWADQVFSRALETDEDPVHRVREGIRYNPFAIAFAGMIYALQTGVDENRARALLSVAARENPAAAHGLTPALKTLIEIDGRLARSALRCAFVASVKPRKVWNLPDDQVRSRDDHYRSGVAAAVDLEMDWLFEGNAEPAWPEFPEEPVKTRRKLRLPGGERSESKPPVDAEPPNEHVDRQSASLWLNAVAQDDSVDQYRWTDGLVRSYAQATAVANGAGLELNAEVRRAPREWNRGFFELFARGLGRMRISEIDTLLATTVTDLPDEPFFDAVTDFLRAADNVYFNEPGLDDDKALQVRQSIAKRLMTSRGWRSLKRSSSASVEIHIAPAVATVFFNNHLSGQQPSCYLYEKGIDKIVPFLPVLNELILSCPSQFVAMATLSLVEVSPRRELLRLFVTAANCWLVAHGQDVDYWVDYGIGSRICDWLQSLYDRDPSLFNADQPMRPDIDHILSALVRFGFADASLLEQILESNSQ